ncbi:hypothetical protein GLOIN_2v1476811 [Rhizophagus irregularis DAOM 181602=DAOM 197198]|nr:hypothetical protein GLOIN_2v1476811 [Rhizophagus irregularis DAOM 181602=DAOM 197198]
MVQLYADILLLIMLELQDDISSLHSCILSNHQTSKLTYLLWFNFTQIFFIAMVQLYADILILIMLELQDDISSLHSCVLVKSFKSRRNEARYVNLLRLEPLVEYINFRRAKYGVLGWSERKWLSITAFGKVRPWPTQEKMEIASESNFRAFAAELVIFYANIREYADCGRYS